MQKIHLLKANGWIPFLPSAPMDPSFVFTYAQITRSHYIGHTVPCFQFLIQRVFLTLMSVFPVSDFDVNNTQKDNPTVCFSFTLILCSPSSITELQMYKCSSVVQPNQYHLLLIIFKRPRTLKNNCIENFFLSYIYLNFCSKNSLKEIYLKSKIF